MKKNARLSGKAVEGMKGLLSDLGGIARKPLDGIDSIKGALDAGTRKKAPPVGILLGSASDHDVMKGVVEVLDEFNVAYEIDIGSAHRMPGKVAAYAKAARERGVEVIVCGAGMAAHLAGAVAANTTLPVIGVPLKSGALAGVDALYATVQMPSGVPVATVAIDGAKNAAYLACEILSIKYPNIADRLAKHRAESRAAMEKTAERIRKT